MLEGSPAEPQRHRSSHVAARARIITVGAAAVATAGLVTAMALPHDASAAPHDRDGAAVPDDGRLDSTRSAPPTPSGLLTPAPITGSGGS